MRESSQAGRLEERCRHLELREKGVGLEQDREAIVAAKECGEICLRCQAGKPAGMAHA